MGKEDLIQDYCNPAAPPPLRTHRPTHTNTPEPKPLTWQDPLSASVLCAQKFQTGLLASLRDTDWSQAICILQRGPCTGTLSGTSSPTGRLDSEGEMQVRSLPAQMPALILASNGLCRIFGGPWPGQLTDFLYLTKLRLA